MTQKEKTFLDQTAQRLHLTVDGESSILFGSVGGYQTMLWRNDQGLAVMTLSLHKLGQEPDQSMALIKTQKMLIYQAFLDLMLLYMTLIRCFYSRFSSLSISSACLFGYR